MAAARTTAHHKIPALREKTPGSIVHPAQSRSGRIPTSAMDENCSQQSVCIWPSVSASSAPNQSVASRQKSFEQKVFPEKVPCSTSARANSREITASAKAIGSPCNSSVRAETASPDRMHCPITVVRTLRETAAPEKFSFLMALSSVSAKW